MNLSEAIRLGSTLRPQIGGHLFGDGRSCALGAAGEAIGAEPKDCASSWTQIRSTWPWTLQTSFLCPACWRPGRPVKALDLITHLNDFHRWTRERIAVWVASVEPSQELVDGQAPKVDEAGSQDLTGLSCRIRGKLLEERFEQPINSPLL